MKQTNPYNNRGNHRFRIGKLAASIVAVVGLLGVTAAQAGQASWDLNDPNQTNQFIFRGSGVNGANWVQETNAQGQVNGYLQITKNVDSQNGTILFPDFDNGLVVRAFTFECKVKLGDGENPPADGFSLNYASSLDPVIQNILAGGSGIGQFAGSADNGGTETGLPEEGTTTGLGIGFDTWGLPGGSNGPQDQRGISIRVNGTQRYQQPLPTILVNNPAGDPNDPTSLETGTAGSGTGTNLTWQPLRVIVDEAGVINVYWKGRQILTNYQSDFFPLPGRIVLGGRTGGNNSYQLVDDISITTVPATNFIISGLVGRADSVQVQTIDAPGSTVQANTVRLSLNGTELPPASYTVAKAGTITTVRASLLPNFLASGSTNTAAVTATDNNGFTATSSRQFVVRAYATMDPAWKAAAGAYNTAAPGFKGYINQIAIGRFPGDANNIWNTARQIAGGYIDPATSQPYANLVERSAFTGVAADGTFTVPNDTGSDYGPYFNWNQDVNGVTQPYTQIGSFTSARGQLYEDALIPGIPGTTTNTDNIVMEAYGYVELTGPKLYTFVVNSDDGFRVTTGPNARSIFGLVLTNGLVGQFNGGKGSSDVEFDVVVPQGAGGVYPLRLAWWEGGGGANLEFFELQNVTNKVLFSDPAVSSATKIYQPTTTAQAYAPAVVSMAPWPGQTGLRPDTAYQVILQDGSSATITASTIRLLLNGNAQTITTAKVGDRTRVSAPTASPLPPPAGGANTLTLEWGDSTGKKTTNTWTFSTSAYKSLPEALARPVGSGTDPGFAARVHQLETLTNGVQAPNRIHFADQQLENLFGPTKATVPANIDQVLQTINFNGDEPLANVGFFNGDIKIPGIPGTTVNTGRVTDNIAMGVTTYIEFPTAGYYEMGVNSDDGFRVIGREKWQRLPMKIESPSTLFASQGNWVGAASRGPQNSTTEEPLPVTPVQNNIVLAQPFDAATDLTNTNAMAGKIGMVFRSAATGTATRVDRVHRAGAIAVIHVNSDEDNVTTDGRLPRNAIGVNAADQNIPVVEIMLRDGVTISNALVSGPVVASIGKDPTPTLGFYNDGRGQGTATLFGFLVPKAGLYPFHLTWFEGGGGANCEWFMRSLAGAQVLINDTNNVAVGLKAFRTAPPVTEQAKFNAPVLNANGSVTLTWTGTGTLQQSAKLPAVTTDWSDVATSGNTYTVTPDPANPQKYYRIKQ